MEQRQKCGISCDVFRAPTYPPHTLANLSITHTHTHHPGRRKKACYFPGWFWVVSHFKHSHGKGFFPGGKKDYTISTFYCRYTCLPPPVNSRRCVIIWLYFFLIIINYLSLFSSLEMFEIKRLSLFFVFFRVEI